jgi:adenylate cyclase
LFPVAARVVLSKAPWPEQDLCNRTGQANHNQLLNTDSLTIRIVELRKFPGTIDKFMGDAVLAIFGSPEPDARQHENAIQAAMEMQAAVRKLNEARELRGASCRDFGIGVHCGEVVHGFVGTSDRMEFTVIGDAVNRAARYCAAAAGGEVLISPEMHERVWRFAETDRTTIRTKHEGNFNGYRVKCLRKVPE